MAIYCRDDVQRSELSLWWLTRRTLKPAACGLEPPGLVRNLADNPLRKYYYWKLQLWATEDETLL